MKKEYNMINFLKFICAIMVVLIHTISRETNIEHLCLITSRVAVPNFFIITGYFMCEKIYNKDLNNIRKYALKIFNIYIISTILLL